MSSQPKWSLGSWAYEWNANGSLHKIKRADGKVFTFKYDAFGRRISKKYLRREFLYIWDGNVLLHEIKKDYQLEDQLTTWIFQDFVPVAKLQGDKSYSIISDHIGTPLVAIDNEGVKVWERELDIYGKVRKETKENPNFVPFRYQGQYYDSEVDLCYNRFRYYDCNIGSYISQDPIRLAGNNPTLYGYVFDTNTWVDVFGLDCSKNDKKPIIYKFKKVEDVEHFEKHSKSIMNALEVDSYNLKQYLVDANMVIKEGIFIPQINGYAKLIGGVGSAKFGFVGLDRLTNNITTFHIKTLGELAKKSPDIFIK